MNVTCHDLDRFRDHLLRAERSAADMNTAFDSGANYVHVQGAEFSEKLTIGRANSAVFVDCSFSGDNDWDYADNATFIGCTFRSNSDNAAIHFDELFGKLIIKDCVFESGKIKRGEAGYTEGTQLSRIRDIREESDNLSGVRGVYLESKTGRYRARITFRGKQYDLGSYTTLEDAVKARRRGEEEYFGQFLQEYERAADPQGR